MATAAVPDISVTPPNALAEVNAIAEHDAAKDKVPVYTFDPNAPPEAKAAVAEQGKDKLKSDKDTNGNGGIGE